MYYLHSHFHLFDHYNIAIIPLLFVILQLRYYRCCLDHFDAIGNCLNHLGVRSHLHYCNQSQ